MGHFLLNLATLCATFEKRRSHHVVLHFISTVFAFAASTLLSARYVGKYKIVVKTSKHWPDSVGPLHNMSAPTVIHIARHRCSESSDIGTEKMSGGHGPWPGAKTLTNQVRQTSSQHTQFPGLGREVSGVYLWEQDNNVSYRMDSAIAPERHGFVICFEPQLS